MKTNWFIVYYHKQGTPIQWDTPLCKVRATDASEAVKASNVIASKGFELRADMITATEARRIKL